jgi:hypothetical protein
MSLSSPGGINFPPQDHWLDDVSNTTFSRNNPSQTSYGKDWKVVPLFAQPWELFSLDHNSSREFAQSLELRPLDQNSSREFAQPLEFCPLDQNSSREPVVPNITAPDSPVVSNITAPGSPVVSNNTATDPPVVSNNTATDPPVDPNMTAPGLPVASNDTARNSANDSNDTASGSSDGSGSGSSDDSSTPGSGADGNQEDAEYDIAFSLCFAMFAILIWVLWHRQNGLLVGFIVFACHCVLYVYTDLLYVMISLLCCTCWFLFWWMQTARFFRAKLTSYSKDLDRVWSETTSIVAIETIDKYICRDQIVLIMLYFAEYVRELERGVWKIDISKEKIHFMSLVAKVHGSASDFGDRMYYGSTYLEAFDALRQAVDPQPLLLHVVREGTDQQVGTGVSGPQAPSALQAPALGAGQSPAPSVV